MFYLFHHVPKCGGTSFNAFLETIFKTHDDYSYLGKQLDPVKRPEEFEKHRTTKLDLAEMGPEDCVAGHFGLPGVFLWERYPDLETLPHRKFTIIRDPFDAAKSGVRFAIKRGRLSEDLTPAAKTRLLLRRSEMFGKILGINSVEAIDDVMSKFWLVAPLEKIDSAAQIIARAAGKIIIRLNM